LSHGDHFLNYTSLKCSFGKEAKRLTAEYVTPYVKANSPQWGAC